MKRTTVYSLVFFALFATFSIGVKRWAVESGRPEGGLSSGSHAPEFTLSSLDGKTVDLGKTTERNRVVVVNFWATWCGPCRLEMPQFDRAYTEMRAQGLEILAISDEPAEAIREYLSERPVEFPILLDTDGEVAKLYEVEALPTTVVLNRHGQILMVRRGLQPGFEQALKRIVMAESDG